MKNKITILFIAVVLLTGFLTTCLEEIPPEKITITFKCDESASFNFEPVIIERGKSLGSKFPSSVPVRTEENFEFIGWYNGYTEYTSETKVYVDITLNAKWKETFEYVTVSFQVDGAASPLPVEVIKGDVIGVRLPTVVKREGYPFDCWLYNGAEFSKDTPITNNITLTAQWGAELTKFTVTYRSNGGTSVDSMSVYEGDCIDEWGVRFPEYPDDIQYIIKQDGDEYYFLKEWHNANGVLVTGRTPITGNITLTAQWLQALPEETFELDLSDFTTKHYNIASANNAEFKDGILTVTFTGENQGISIANPPELRELLGKATSVSIEIEGTVSHDDRMFRVLLGNPHLLGREWNMTKSHDNVTFFQLSRDLEIDDNRNLDTNTAHEEYNPDPDYKRVNWTFIQSRTNAHSSASPTTITISSLKVTVR